MPSLTCLPPSLGNSGRTGRASPWSRPGYSPFALRASEDRRVEHLTIIAALTDGRGNFVAGKRSELELDFTDKTFEQFAKTGFTAAVTIQAPLGAYSGRAVAQDGVEGKLAAASGNVSIK